MESHLHEARLVRDVLGTLPHEVGFKYYPGQAYPDRDPILDVVESTPNVRLLKTAVDLRFLITGARVVMTVGASSTLGWCLSSRRPLVYIDPSADGYRLDRELVQEFRRYAGYFDRRDPAMFAQLKAFLSRPLADIETEWRRTAAARVGLLRSVIGDERESPGRNGYRWLTSKMPGTARS
jgi:hypothetical protein